MIREAWGMLIADIDAPRRAHISPTEMKITEDRRASNASA